MSVSQCRRELPTERSSRTDSVPDTRWLDDCDYCFGVLFVIVRT